VGDMSCGLSVGVLECVRIFRYDIFEGEAKSAKSNDGKAFTTVTTITQRALALGMGAAAAYHDSRPSRTRWSSPVGMLRCAPTLQPRDGSRSYVEAWGKLPPPSCLPLLASPPFLQPPTTNQAILTSSRQRHLVRPLVRPNG
jgi:hypothetical protein